MKTIDRFQKKMSAALSLLFGSAARDADHRRLTRYIVSLNQKESPEEIINELASCLKNILNYRLFGFAVKKEETTDVWLDPFMGLNPEEVSTEDTAGTLTEALNMIAGNALRKIDDRASSHLGLPEPIGPSDLRKAGSPVLFETIGGRLAIDAESRQPSGTAQKGEA